MEQFNFVEIAAIVVIVYLLAEGVKLIGKGKLNRFLPVICGALGGILALVAYFCLPGYIPAENVLEALAIGIVSGFSATGVNQVYKQLSDKEE